MSDGRIVNTMRMAERSVLKAVNYAEQTQHECCQTGSCSLPVSPSQSTALTDCEENRSLLPRGRRRSMVDHNGLPHDARSRSGTTGGIAGNPCSSFVLLRAVSRVESKVS